MKNKIVQALLLLTATALITIPCVASDGRQDIKIEQTESVAVQEEISTETKIKPKQYNINYCNDLAYVYKNPNVNSEIIDVYSLNQCVQYTNYNDQFSKIKYNDGIGYILTEKIQNQRIQYVGYLLKESKIFKSFMSYKTITSKSSMQYKLQNQYAYTGQYGIRQINDRYCVAIGTAFNAEVGDYVDLILENGEVIECIVSDIKANIHTKADNITTKHNGCVSEFIVDIKSLDKNAKKSGDISDCCDEWNSRVVNVKVYNKNVLKENNN